MFEEKCQAFYHQFFLPAPEANMSDLLEAEYPQEVEPLPIIGYDTVSAIL